MREALRSLDHSRTQARGGQVSLSQTQAELGFRVPSRQALLASGKLERSRAPGVAALQSRDPRTEGGSGVSFGGRLLPPRYLTEPRRPFPQTPELSSQGPARSSEVCRRAAFPRMPGGAVPRLTRKCTLLCSAGLSRVTEGDIPFGDVLLKPWPPGRGRHGDARTSERCFRAAASLHRQLRAWNGR